MLLDEVDLLRFRLDSALLHATKGDDIEAVATLGLQDSSPRSAVLSLHARTAEVDPDAWRDPRLVQVWGPRGAIYLVRRADRVLFTIGLTPRDERARAELEHLSSDLRAHLRGVAAGQPIPQDVLPLDGRGRLAATITGRVAVVWDASTITYRAEDAPEMDVESARVGLARRFLEVFAPATHDHFARWAGVERPDAEQSLRALSGETVTVRFRGEERLVLGAQIDRLRSPTPTAAVCLLPPGDPYLGGPDRDVIAPEGRIRSAVWPRSVPPGALLVDGRVVGTWRRRGGDVTLQPFVTLDSPTRQLVEREVDTMPLRATMSLALSDVRTNRDPHLPTAGRGAP